MSKKPEEWLRQAEYDIKTADILFKSRRNIYAIFMCHLSIEKALKGLYVLKLGKEAPKTHDLLYLVEKDCLMVPPQLYDFIFDLNEASVPTRYPEDLRRMVSHYPKSKTRDIIGRSKEVLKWLKKMC